MLVNSHQKYAALCCILNYTMNWMLTKLACAVNSEANLVEKCYINYQIKNIKYDDNRRTIGSIFELGWYFYFRSHHSFSLRCSEQSETQ
ncbi:hypothetical protein X798_04167 [Onchocerca flexuosa]|uniref:Secreted protein n=2 Tax=Onchocerca flexuosa TaxID=387005 RepID=A0A183H8C4_9BILA|nr:hypothetical protein X798_04167 [Onchocerca flexuosa]VDO37608.1 unnamed protein product [Onchocerca flexuosa]